MGRRLHPDDGPAPGHRRPLRHRRRTAHADGSLCLPARPGRTLRVHGEGQPQEPAQGNQGSLRPAAPGTGGLCDPLAAARAGAARATRDPVHRISFSWVGQVSLIRRTVRKYRCARNGRPARPGEPSAGTVCGITSHTPETADAGSLLVFNRDHWSCGRVHRILDDAATWNGERCRVRGGHRPENPSCLRRLSPAQPEHAATRQIRRVAPRPATPDQVDGTCRHHEAGGLACPRPTKGRAKPKRNHGVTAETAESGAR